MVALCVCASILHHCYLASMLASLKFFLAMVEMERFQFVLVVLPVFVDASFVLFVALNCAQDLKE